jgi:hypothetical protein
MDEKFQTDILSAIKNSISLYSKGNFVGKNDGPNCTKIVNLLWMRIPEALIPHNHTFTVLTFSLLCAAIVVLMHGLPYQSILASRIY